MQAFVQAVDEELHDVWFEKVPELDVVSVARALNMGKKECMTSFGL